MCVLGGLIKFFPKQTTSFALAKKPRIERWREFEGIDNRNVQRSNYHLSDPSDLSIPRRIFRYSIFTASAVGKSPKRLDDLLFSGNHRSFGCNDFQIDD